MNNVKKYLKIAKDAVIKPSSDIEKKIIDRISHINNTDKSLLDDRFLDFFKKSNSRLYLFIEKVRNNQGLFATLFVTLILIAAFIIFIVKVFIGERKTSAESFKLSSSKNDAQKK